MKVVMWVYEHMLHLYPRPFREAYSEEMLLVFSDLLKREYQKHKWWGVLWISLIIVEDTLMNAVIARQESVSKQARWTGRIASILLIIPATFVFINITKYSLKIDLFYDTVVSLGIGWGDSIIYTSAELLMILIPIVSLAVAALPLFSVRYESSANGILIQRSDQKLSWLGAGVICTGMVVFAIFMIYGIAENFG